MFDDVALAERGLRTGQAAGGRGAAVFFELGGRELVLRHYRRGGLIGRLVERHYISRGLERSRPMREFALLLELERLGLPVPLVFAAQRARRGLFETGSLVTFRLPGTTLAVRLTSGAIDEQLWIATGACIGRFHRAGVRHADLNAHNLLVTDAAVVSLIDFDRGQRLSAPARPERAPVWARANLERLHRSLEKVCLAAGRPIDRAGVRALDAAWSDAILRDDQSARAADDAPSAVR